MNDERPARPERPIGPSEAREKAETAARAGKWQESIAWSLLGMLASSGRR